MEDIKITKDNDFRITLAATCCGEHLNLNGVANLVVDIPNAPIGSYTYAVDTTGMLVLDFDGPSLSVRPYGMEAKGTIDGRDWCWRVKKLFEVVKYTDESTKCHNISMGVTCEPVGFTLFRVASVTLEEMEETTLMPNTLYIVVGEGRPSIPPNGHPTYTID